MDAYRASDRWRSSISRVDRMDARPLDDHQARAQILGVITVQIERAGSIWTVGLRSKERNRSIFITHLKHCIWTLHLKSDDRDIFRNGPSWTFHRNRRSFRLNGYDQKPYIKRCSSTIVSIRVEISIQLSCLDTSLSFLLIPSSSSLISASTEGLKSRFGGESKEKSPLESIDRVLRVLHD